MKNIIILILVMFFLNNHIEGQTSNCDKLIDVYGIAGENLTIDANSHLQKECYNPCLNNNCYTYHWTKNGDEISCDNSFDILSLNENNTGLYKCLIMQYNPNTHLYDSTTLCFLVSITESLEERFPRNEIIIDIENMSDSNRIHLTNWLLKEKFVKIDSCLCNSIELWVIDSDMSEMELASTIKRAADETDKDGGKSSRNYFAEPDVPLYCLEENQYKWQTPPPSNYSTDKIVNIAILDNGFDTSMFPNNLWTGVSSTEACCLTDPHGYNALSECETVSKREHGTVVASTMASFVPENISYEMMNLKAIDQRKGSLFRVACAAKYAMRSGADIINLSMGYYGRRSTLLDTLISEARDSNILIIASSGNGGEGRTNHWPSNYSNPIYGFDNVISVGSSNFFKEQTDFSSNADIYAPGHNLICESIDNVPVLKSGTSFSTAFVTASAAACLSENPDFDPNQIINALLTDTNWSSDHQGLTELNVSLIEMEDSIEYQDTLVINQTISEHEIFDAVETIESSATLLDGADVSMRAGNSIHFSLGFKCEPGSILLAIVKTCDENTNNTRLAQAQVEEIKEPEPIVATKDEVSFENKKTSNNDKLIVTPNPFHEQTTISFELEEDIFVELTIYSALGQKIKTLFKGQRDKGYYENVFYAKGIPSGVYYVHLIKGDTLVTKKIVLQ